MKAVLNKDYELEKMKELAIEKIGLLLKDLKEMQKMRVENGKSYFTEELFAIRVKEIYKILKNEENE